VTADTVYLAAGIAASLVVVVGFLKPVRRPFAWLWRRNVAEPIGEWFRHVNEESTKKVVHQVVEASLGSVVEKVDEVAAKVDLVEHAVNGRPDNEQTISQDVRQLAQTVVPMRAEVTVMAGQMVDVRRDVAATRAEQAMQRERIAEVARKAEVAAREAAKAAEAARALKADDDEENP
jgi:hypothetical protein